MNEICRRRKKSVTKFVQKLADLIYIFLNLNILNVTTYINSGISRIQGENYGDMADMIYHTSFDQGHGEFAKQEASFKMTLNVVFSKSLRREVQHK